MIDDVKAENQVAASPLSQEAVDALVSGDQALTSDHINALQSGAVAAEGMPEQAKDIAPVDAPIGELIRELYELKARVNFLEMQHNTLCKEKGYPEYQTNSLA